MTAKKKTKTELKGTEPLLFSITHERGVEGIASGLLLRERLNPYSWDKNGMVLRLNIESDDETQWNSLAKHIAECISKEALRYAGDQYFNEKPIKEKWEIWRVDSRFVDTYCNEKWVSLLQLTLIELAKQKREGLNLPTDYEEFKGSLQFFEKIEEDFKNGSHISEMQKMGWS